MTANAKALARIGHRSRTISRITILYSPTVDCWRYGLPERKTLSAASISSSAKKEHCASDDAIVVFLLYDIPFFYELSLVKVKY
jgi:hypothetical protein